MYRSALVGLTVVLSSTSCSPSHIAATASPDTEAEARARATTAEVAIEPAGPPAALLAPPPFAVAVEDAVTGGAPPFAGPAADSEDAGRALDCLTAAVYYEGRSEPLDGQRAIAQVVLNRVRNPTFPASVCGVVYQGSARKTGCQFTFTCDGSMLFRREPDAWERARYVAQSAFEGSVYAPVGAATYYHTTAILPWWAPSLTRVATIGAHIFYRLNDAWANALDFHQSYGGSEPDSADQNVTGDQGGDGGAAIDYVTASGSVIAVHRGGDPSIGGVTIHRNAPPAIDSTASLAANTGTSTPSGVHIHLGAADPTNDAPHAPDAASEPAPGA